VTRKVNVCVSGAAGFLGSHLCERLRKMGHWVFGIDNLIGGSFENVPKKMAFWADDICRLKEIEEIFSAVKKERGKIGLIYHCAASPHEGLSVFSPTIITRNTLMSTVSLATAAINAGVKRLVMLSSMSRYGKGCTNGGEFIPFREDHPAIPVDPYGIAKVASEQVLTCLGKQHGMEVVTLVPHNIYGIRQKYDDPFRNVVSIMANLCLQGRAPIIYGDGEQQRVFSHVDDCIEPIIKAGFQPGLDGEVINIGPDANPVTINSLAKVMGQITGLNGDILPVYVPGRPCEVKVAYCSSDKARRLLGYETKVNPIDGFREVVNWIRQQGTKPFTYHIPIEITAGKGLPETWGKRLF